MSQTFEWCLDKNRLKTFDKQVCYIDPHGNKFWYLNGERHRENGPAVEYANGYKAWYLNDKFHRVNGPAVEFADGGKWWYLNGKPYTESSYWKELGK